MRFGQGEGPEGLAGDHRSEPALVLLGIPPRHDRVLGQDVDRQGHGGRHVGRPELLHHERPAQIAEAGAADGLGQRGAGQAEVRHTRKNRAVEALGLVPFRGTRGDLATGELTGRVTKEAFFLGKRPAQVWSSDQPRGPLVARRSRGGRGTPARGA
jgi:hypothetical protein